MMKNGVMLALLGAVVARGSLAPMPAKPPMCRNLAAVQKCVGDAIPNKNNETGCPSCMKVRPTCDAAARRACAPAECATGVKPERDTTGCCATCKPKECSSVQKTACKAKLLNATATVCNGTRPVYSREDCCYDCVPPKRPVDKRGKKCSRADRKACEETIAPCETDVRVKKVKDQCCGSCLAEELRFKPKAIVDRCKDTPDCAVPVNGTKEEPTRVTRTDGNPACFSCKPARPTCATACADKKICIRGKADANACVSKKVIKTKLKFKAASRGWRTELLAKADKGKKEITLWVATRIRRFCSKEANIEKCEDLKEKILESIDVEVKEGADDSIEVTVDVPDVTEADVVSRRRLVEDSSTTVVEGAMNDNDDDDDIEVTITQDTSTAMMATAGLMSTLALMAL